MRPVIDQLIRSKRRSIGLQIHPDGKLIVHAPLKAPLRVIEAAIDEKSEWIMQKQQQAAARRSLLPPHQCANGELFLLCGESYPLIFDAAVKSVTLQNGVLYAPPVSDERLVMMITRWYQGQAAQILRQATQSVTARAGVSCKTVRITGALTRWGSCSAKGGICYTWRLVQAPPGVIEYVVVHEVCHLTHHNHSSAFWQAVESLCPDFSVHQKWLREHSALLRPDFFARDEA